jgi:predicted enzyme related to lactoylglutathione lyase
MLEDGKISYVEMPGQDLPATKDFYASAFGWTFTDYGLTYAAFGDAGIDGGFDAHPDAVTKPLVVLFAKDLESMEARVKASGGVITVPIFAFPGGRRFHFRDPSGNELAVFTEA